MIDSTLDSIMKPKDCLTDNPNTLPCVAQSRYEETKLKY